ncbi:MAG: DinB family protein [Actinomycetota bacterium]
MSNVWTSGLMQMFDVVLNEFEETLRACPDHLWEASMWDVSKDQGYWRPEPPVLANGNPDPRGIQVHSTFWYVAFHTLFTLDWNFAERVPTWTPPKPFGKNDLDTGTLPPRTYSRDELLAYVEFNYAKTMSILTSLSDADATRPTLAPIRGEHPPLATRLLNNLLHTAGHHGTLDTFVWQHRP